MLICLSITQILGHIYSIVDADLYIIHEEMLTLVKLHRILKECSVRNKKKKKIKKLSNLIFLFEVIKTTGLEFMIRAPPEFQCVDKINKKIQYRNKLPLAYFGF